MAELWTCGPNAMIRRGVASQEAGVSPTIQIVEDRPNVDRSTGEESDDEDRRTGRSSSNVPSSERVGLSLHKR
jgi:hypothetical protein